MKCCSAGTDAFNFVFLYLLGFIFVLGALIQSGAQASSHDTPAYLIDFVLSMPKIDRISDQKAVVTGRVMNWADHTPSKYSYTITIEHSEGPIKNNVIEFPPMAGRGPTRFPNNATPEIKNIGDTPSLEIALLGAIGHSDDLVQGRGMTFYRDPSSKTTVSLSLGELIELSNIHFTLTGLDGELGSMDCNGAEPNNYACGNGYIDRVTILGSKKNVSITTADSRHLSIEDNSVSVVVPNNQSGPVNPARVDISHVSALGNTLQFVFDDPGIGINGDPDTYHDFDAAQVSIGLASGIMFDLKELSPLPPPAPDPNLTAVSGVVYQDFNSNNEQDDDEPGEAGVEVLLFSINGQRRKIAKTDESGRYVIDDVIANQEYRLEARRSAPPAPNGENIHPLRYIKHIVPKRRPAKNNYDFGQWPRLQADLESAQLLLPDLQPLSHFPQEEQVSEQERAELIRAYPGMTRWNLDSKTQPDHVLLRFGTLAVNKGKGPLHLLGGVMEGQRRHVYQRIYAQTGEFIQQAVNEFLLTSQKRDQLSQTMKEKADRRLVNVELFEQYNLRNVETDQIVASGHKISFCLTDILSAIDPGLQKAAPIGIVPLGWTCGEDEQSINVGFSDYYGPALPNQWIDVTDVPDGAYWLEVVVNPAQVIRESDYSNNHIRIKISLKQP